MCNCLKSKYQLNSKVLLHKHLVKLNHIFTSLKKTKEQLCLLFFTSFVLRTWLGCKAVSLLAFPMIWGFHFSRAQDTWQLPSSLWDKWEELQSQAKSTKCREKRPRVYSDGGYLTNSTVMGQICFHFYRITAQNWGAFAFHWGVWRAFAFTQNTHWRGQEERQWHTLGTAAVTQLSLSYTSLSCCLLLLEQEQWQSLLSNSLLRNSPSAWVTQTNCLSVIKTFSFLKAHTVLNQIHLLIAEFFKTLLVKMPSSPAAAEPTVYQDHWKTRCSSQDEITLTVSRCVRWCFARSLELLKAFWQPGCWHRYGFSPVWLRRWILRFSSLENALLHPSNWKTS